MATGLERLNLALHSLTVRLSLKPGVLEYERVTKHSLNGWQQTAFQINKYTVHAMFFDEAMIHLVIFSNTLS